MTSTYAPLRVDDDEDASGGVAEPAADTAGDADGGFVNAAFVPTTGGGVVVSLANSDDDSKKTHVQAHEDDTAAKAPPRRRTLKERLRMRRTPPPPERVLTEEERAIVEAEFKEELSHYITQVYELIRPIVFTFCFTVWFVQRMFQTMDVSQYSPINVYAESSEDDTWSRFGGALLNTFIMIGGIVIVTFIFVCLFYFRLMWILYGWLGLSVTTTLAGIGGTVLYALCQSYNVTLDWISLSFFLWNFAAVGILSVMWNSPLYIQQGYLVLISALLATNFTFLPEWTAWVFLAAISIYDLLSVLCPGGPLKMLVELSQKRNEPIPALLYSSGMADFSSATQDTKLVFTTSGSSGTTSRRRVVADEPDDEDDFEDGNEALLNMPLYHDSSNPANAEAVPLMNLGSGGVLDEEQAQQADQQQQVAEEDDQPKGVQLGLGDFIFYSVLVARASLTNWLTLIACALATLTGLCLTLLLLSIFRKALPALPLSIAFGMIFYFASRSVITPYMNIFSLHGVVV